MEPDRDTARDVHRDQRWPRMVRSLGERLRGSAPALAREVNALQRDAEPSMFPEPGTVMQNLANIQAGFLAIAELLEGGGDPDRIELPPGLAAAARSRAQRGASASALQRLFRIAHEHLWEWCLGQLVSSAAPEEERAEAIGICAKLLFRVVDRLVVESMRLYESERDRWVRGASAVRSETISRLLAGTELDVPSASARLGYELERHHLGLIVWTSDPRATVSGASLPDTVSDLARALGAESQLVEPLGLLASAAWLGRAASFEAGRLDRALSSSAAPSVCIAAGEPGWGEDGFRRTHAEALDAQRVALRARRMPRGAVRYGRVELVALATADPERAARFVTRVLGPLAAEDDDTAGRLAATVAVVLDENGSRLRAARRLGVHENTIAYRMRQVEELLGRKPEADLLRLRMALLLLPYVGSGSGEAR